MACVVQLCSGKLVLQPGANDRGEVDRVLLRPDRRGTGRNRGRWRPWSHYPHGDKRRSQLRLQRDREEASDQSKGAEKETAEATSQAAERIQSAKGYKRQDR